MELAEGGNTLHVLLTLIVTSLFVVLTGCFTERCKGVATLPAEDAAEGSVPVQEEAVLCAICFEQPERGKLVPWGHFQLCVECACSTMNIHPSVDGTLHTVRRPEWYKEHRRSTKMAAGISSPVKTLSTFKSMDRNGDGVIDEAEYNYAVKECRGLIRGVILLCGYMW